MLFLVASAYGILAVSRRFLSFDTASMPWRIAWVNMLGSVLFMASALASYVLPDTDEVLTPASPSPGPSSAPCASSSAPP